MSITINAKELRASLPKLIERVRKGARFTVLYRSHPAFQIIPIDEPDTPRTPLDTDTLYHAGSVGRSNDGRSAADHDSGLYGK